jgi:hypothetical protein
MALRTAGGRGRALLLGLVLSAGASVSTVAPVANAQVSEADRRAARELFEQGYQLQQAGNYAPALEKFSRAQAVFSAPTNLLHIAECEAQLGLLVEAAETYRGLNNLVLPAGASPAFAAAQVQGRAELQQVEARIPKVRIEVTPPNAPNMAVTIDDQPMNVALVGEARPIDPGPHKIVVVAFGYNRVEKSIVIKEKEPPQVVAFALQGNGILVGPPGSVPGAMPMPMPMQGPQGQMIYTVPYAVPPVQPYMVQQYRPPPKRDYTSLGFFFGGRIGAAIPTNIEGASTGVGADLEAYLRFAHKWFVGLYGGRDFYRASPAGGPTPSRTDLGAGIGLTTNPEGVGFMIDLTFGYRWLTLSDVTTSPGNGSVEGGLGMGIWIAVGKHFRLVPRVDFSAGSVSINTSNSDGGYAAFFAGISAYYNLDFKPKGAQVVAAPPVEEAPAPGSAPSPAPATPGGAPPGP